MADSKLLCATAAFVTVAAAFIVDEEDNQVIMAMRIGRTHHVWMHPYLRERDNEKHKNLTKIEKYMISTGSADKFMNTVRMPVWMYNQLEAWLKPYLTKQTTNFRKPIPPEDRLSLTLRYLCHGDSALTLGQAYLEGDSTVLPLIRFTCTAIIRVLMPRYLKVPRTEEEWLEIARGFMERWNFPHVLGAIDGKHIRIRRPKRSGSEFYNYKGFFSNVLFAACDAEKRFIYVDVGSQGRASDSTIWKSSRFYRDICDERNPLHIPKPTSVDGIEGFPLPYFFVGDDAFALDTHVMKPLPRPGAYGDPVADRVYNYRVSRARLPIENTFGILAARMRIFQRCQDMEPDGVRLVVLASVCLHNYLATEAKRVYMPRAFVDTEDPNSHVVRPGDWRQDEQMTALAREQYGRGKQYVNEMRKRLVQYCQTPEGALPWQNAMI